jgi:hypothetical protein
LTAFVYPGNGFIQKERGWLIASPLIIITS